MNAGNLLNRVFLFTVLAVSVLASAQAGANGALCGGLLDGPETSRFAFPRTVTEALASKVRGRKYELSQLQSDQRILEGHIESLKSLIAEMGENDVRTTAHVTKYTWNMLLQLSKRFLNSTRKNKSWVELQGGEPDSNAEPFNYLISDTALTMARLGGARSLRLDRAMFDSFSDQINYVDGVHLQSYGNGRVKASPGKVRQTKKGWAISEDFYGTNQSTILFQVRTGPGGQSAWVPLAINFREHSPRPGYGQNDSFVIDVTNPQVMKAVAQLALDLIKAYETVNTRLIEEAGR